MPTNDHLKDPKYPRTADSRDWDGDKYNPSHELSHEDFLLLDDDDQNQYARIINSGYKGDYVAGHEQAKMFERLIYWRKRAEAAEAKLNAAEEV